MHCTSPPPVMRARRRADFSLVSKKSCGAVEGRRVYLISRCVAENTVYVYPIPIFVNLQFGALCKKWNRGGYHANAVKSKKSIFSDDKTRRHSRNLTAPGARRRKIMLHDFEFSSISNIREREKMWKVRLSLWLCGCSTVNAFLSLLVRRSKNFPFTVLWRNSYALVVCLNRCSVKSYVD